MPAPKNLTDQERLMFMNQFLILEHTHPHEAKFYKQASEILRYGYTEMYGTIFEQLHTELDPDVAKEVVEILQLHRILIFSAQKLKIGDEEILEEIKFAGFDGNLEPEYLLYAQFYCESQDYYKELHVTNSHHRTLNRYYRMLKKYEELGKPNHLTEAQIREVVEAGTFSHSI